MAGRKKKESFDRLQMRHLNAKNGINVATQEVYDMQTASDGTKARSLRSYFGTDRASAVAYFISSMLGKGYADDEILIVVNERFGLDWTLKKLSTMKELCRKVWRAQMVADMNDQIAEEVNAINLQIRELWEAWEKSKQGITKTRKRHEDSAGLQGAEDTNYDVNEDETENESSAGDVKYMMQINELGKEKRKLLGLYQKEKKSEGGGGVALQINIVGQQPQVQMNKQETVDAIAEEVVEALPESKEGAKVPVMVERMNVEDLYAELMDE